MTTGADVSRIAARGGRRGQAGGNDRPWMLRVVRIALMPSSPTLQQHESKDDGQHRQRDLRRPGEVRACHPRRVDGNGQRADAKEFRGADIVQRLHERQAEPQRDGGPGQRQRNPDERLTAGQPERSPGLEEACRLHREQRSGRQVHIGIQHEAQHPDAPGHRTNVRQPELSGSLVAEHPPQGFLHGTHRVQDVQVGVGDDVASAPPVGGEGSHRGAGGRENRTRSRATPGPPRRSPSRPATPTSRTAVSTKAGSST